MSEMEWEDIHNDKWLEYPFLCFAQLPTLQEMASYRICQATWLAYTSSQNTSLWTIIQQNVEYGDEEYTGQVKELVKGLTIAKPIKEILIQAEKTIADELFNYMVYLGRNFPGQINPKPDILPLNLSWCVWLPNGQIDYRTSAIEMLKSGRLDEMQKFIVMSKSCMEDEMKNICLESLPHLIKDVYFVKNPLLFYWVCYLKKELWRVPWNEKNSLEETMAVHCYKDNEMIALKYFWLRMTNDDRISTAVKILSDLERGYSGRVSWPILERLFSSISSTSTRPLADLCGKYLRQSVEKSSSTQHQLRLWHRFADEITDNAFAGIISGVFANSIDSEDRMRILLHMWDSANDHRKEYVTQHEAKSMIERFANFTKYRETLSRLAIFARNRETLSCLAASEMLYRILSRKPESERSQLFRQYADQFASQIKPAALLQKTMDLCLPSATDQSQLKNTFSQSEVLQELCVLSLQHDEYDYLNAELEWVFSDRDPNSIFEYKKRILTLMTYKYACELVFFFVSVDKWNKLSVFIDQVFTQDRQSASELKRTYVKLAIPLIRSMRHFHQYFDVAKQIIEIMLPAQDLRYFKHMLRESLVEQFQLYTYWKAEHGKRNYEIFLPHLVAWLCDNDVQSISEFKKSVPLGAILSAITQDEVIVAGGYRKRYSHQIHLEAFLRRVDRHLMWFVGSDEKVRECKLKAIECCTINVRTFAVSEYEENHYTRFRDVVLRWFCSGDEEAVRRFKAQRCLPPT